MPDERNDGEHGQRQMGTQVERVDAAAMLKTLTQEALVAMRDRLRSNEPLAQWLRSQMRRPGKYLAVVVSGDSRRLALACDLSAAGCPTARVVCLLPEGQASGEMAALALHEPSAFIGFDMVHAKGPEAPKRSAEVDTLRLFD